jgi:hypothetical protein
MAAHVRKVTLAIGDAEYEWAARRAKREGTSISAVITAATKEKRQTEARDEQQRQAWSEIKAYVSRERPLTEEEVEAAAEELDRIEASQPRSKARGPNRRSAAQTLALKRIARARLDALRELGQPVPGDEGKALPQRGPKGGLWRPLELYGLLYEKPAREILGLSQAKFRALVLPSAWVENPKYSTAPKVGVYDPLTLRVLRDLLTTKPEVLDEQRRFVTQRRAEIDDQVHEEHTAFMQRARHWRNLRAERQSGRKRR